MAERYQESVLEELIGIRRVLEFLAEDKLRTYLDGIISTDQRQKMWSLLDGNYSTTEIANKSGITPRAVQLFIKELQQLDLILMVKRGYPKRKLDYVPLEWRNYDYE